MPKTDPVLSARGRLAYASTRMGSPEAIEKARRELTAAKLERAVNEAIEAAPPITQQQRERIAAILTGGDA